jgi:hypothetical protein
MTLYQFQCRPVKPLEMLAACLSLRKFGFDPRLLFMVYAMETLVVAHFSPTTWVFPYQYYTTNTPNSWAG